MKRIALALAALLIVAGLWTWAWWSTAAGIKSGLTAPQPQGPQFACATLTVTGYPFALHIDCADLSVTDGDLSFSVPHLSLKTPFPSADRYALTAAGPALLTDAFTGSQTQLSWTGLEGHARLDNWRLRTLTLDAKALTYADALIPNLTMAKIGVAKVSVDDAGDGPVPKTAALAVKATIGDLTLPGLAPDTAQIKLSAGLAGLPDDVRVWANPSLLPYLAAIGGKLTLQTLALETPTIKADLTGDLGLDTSHRPQGQLTLTSRGLAPRLGLIMQPTLVGLIVGTTDQDGLQVQTFAFKDGIASAGGVPVSVLTPLF